MLNLLNFTAKKNAETQAQNAKQANNSRFQKFPYPSLSKNGEKTPAVNK